MQQVRATQERNRNYRAVVHLSDKRFVQLATPDLPNVNPGVDPNRAIGTSDLPYRKEMSWDTTLQRRLPRRPQDRRSAARCSSTGAAAPTMSPGGNYLLYFDEPQADWFTLSHRRRRARNLTERLPVKFWTRTTTRRACRRRSARPAGPTATSRCCSTTSSTSGRSGRTARSPRMVTGGEGRKQKLVFRYRTLDPEQRAIPTDKPMLLSTTNDETRRAATTASPTRRQRRAREDHDDRQGSGRADQGEERRRRRLHAVALRRVPGPLGQRHAASAPKKISNANPQQASSCGARPRTSSTSTPTARR